MMGKSEPVSLRTVPTKGYNIGKLASINVRGMANDLKMGNVIQAFENLRIDSLCVQETRRRGNLKELMTHETEDSLLKKYGIVVSTFPIAQLICSAIFGKIADVTHSIRPTSSVMSVVYTGASVLYATLSDISYELQSRFYLMILARFYIGAFSANIEPIQGYICQVPTED